MRAHVHAPNDMKIETYISIFCTKNEKNRDINRPLCEALSLSLSLSL
ncbi:hypothetical protein M2132_000400 [Dysgonomonas sp. PH5-45]|nr:hypothetical protein [Dysgonomonas sp. PH5-45]